jgi:hypothetical protein
MSELPEQVWFDNGFPCGQAEGPASQEATEAMNRSPIFWTAFWAGMSAPVALFAAPVGNYAAYASSLSAAQSFSIVGGFLTSAANQVVTEHPQLYRYSSVES